MWPTWLWGSPSNAPSSTIALQNLSLRSLTHSIRIFLISVPGHRKSSIAIFESWMNSTHCFPVLLIVLYSRTNTSIRPLTPLFLSSMRASTVHWSPQFWRRPALPLTVCSLGQFLHWCRKHCQSDYGPRIVQDTKDGEMKCTVPSCRLQDSHGLVGWRSWERATSAQCDGGVW